MIGQKQAIAAARRYSSASVDDVSPFTVTINKSLEVADTPIGDLAHAYSCPWCTSWAAGPTRWQDRAPIAAGNRAPSRGRSLNQQA